MELSSFTFIMTESCNFKCIYCYQKKGQKQLGISTIQKALDFFLPFLVDEPHFNFTGGEPLLVFEQVREAVAYIQKKNKNKRRKIEYSLTTNGFLMNDEILEFLARNKFSLMLSYDGLAQDLSREKGSSQKIISLINKINGCEGIDFMTNSVFIPATVNLFSKSIQHIIELGVPEVLFGLSNVPPWDSSSLLRLEKEMSRLREFSLSFFDQTGKIPISNFRRSDSKGMFGCNAGKDRMTIAPDETLWGCYIYADYFNGKKGTSEYEDYCFGTLDSFIDNHECFYPETLTNYSGLLMGCFYTPETCCMICDNLKECVVCPAEAAYSSSKIGKIPTWTCKIRKIIMKERRLFWEELEKKDSRNRSAANRRSY